VDKLYSKSQVRFSKKDLVNLIGAEKDLLKFQCLRDGKAGFILWYCELNEASKYDH